MCDNIARATGLAALAARLAAGYGGHAMPPLEVPAGYVRDVANAAAAAAILSGQNDFCNMSDAELDESDDEPSHGYDDDQYRIFSDPELTRRYARVAKTERVMIEARLRDGWEVPAGQFLLSHILCERTTPSGMEYLVKWFDHEACGGLQPYVVPSWVSADALRHTDALDAYIWEETVSYQRYIDFVTVIDLTRDD